MRLIELIIGSVLVILLFVKLFQGKKYESYIEQLDSDEFPLKSIYIIGFAWSEGQLLKLRGNLKRKLVSQAKLTQDSKYAEYYANVVWAQVISFVHFSLAIGFVLGGAFDFLFLTIVGILCSVVFGYYFITRMEETLKLRKEDCVAELPEIVSTMALLIHSGMMLREAWEIIANGKEGTIYILMREACQNMQNGMSDIEAIHNFGIMSDAPEIKKFTGALIQGMEKGSKDLGELLTKQSSEMWNLKKQIMLQKGEAAASKLLMPIALIFVGIMIVVIAGAIGMLM